MKLGKMSKYDYIVGIDPDCEKSGVAILNIEKKSMAETHCISFPNLMDLLITLHSNMTSKPSLLVVVEAGWLNETHFHLKSGDSRRVSAAKGNSVGRNHETGRKIVEMAKHYGLEVVEQRPLRKCWKGQDGKITHNELKQFVPGLPSRTNQEVRDAALIAWNHAGFPIRIQSNKSKSR